MYVIDGGIECMYRCCTSMPISSHFSKVWMKLYDKVETKATSYTIFKKKNDPWNFPPA